MLTSCHRSFPSSLLTHTSLLFLVFFPSRLSSHPFKLLSSSPIFFLSASLFLVTLFASLKFPTVPLTPHTPDPHTHTHLHLAFT